MRKILAICDREELYTSRFLEYLCRWKDLPFEVKVFRSPETLAEYAAVRKIEILLIAESAVTEEAERIPAGRRILLKEERGTAADGLSVYKYQRAGDVVRKVMDFYGAQLEAEKEVSSPYTGGRVIGVLSVKDAADRNVFSILSGMVLAEKEPVLYLNLERYAGFDRLLQNRQYGTVSDLLYYFRQNRGGFIYRLEGMLQNIRGLSFVGPADNPADFLEVTAGEWAELVSGILRSGRFCTLILDIGCELPDISELLGICGRIFLVSAEDALTAKKEEAFLEWVKEADPSVPQKIRRVLWECPHEAEESADYFEEMLNRREGEAVRREMDGGDI